MLRFEKNIISVIIKEVLHTEYYNILLLQYNIHCSLYEKKEKSVGIVNEVKYWKQWLLVHSLRAQS